MKTKTTLLVAFFLTACAWTSSAQPAFDSSGDAKLNGAYYFRQVVYFVQDQSGDIGEYMNVQGTITFDGGGGYTITNASLLDSASSSATPVTFPASGSTFTGSYVVAASGQGYITAVNPNLSASDQIVGLVSQGGIFIGSTTETGSGYNDLFIAAPISSTPATNATLNGSYSIAYIDPFYPGDALLNLTANGAGNIGTVSVNSYILNNTTATTQTLNNVTYSFSNGAAQLNFGGTRSTKTFIAGTDLLYISPDGNFVFGGNYNGFDMFVGVRAATSNPTNYDGLYYQAGIDLDEAELSASSPYSLLDTYYGSLQAFSQNIIGHQRVNSLLVYGGASDYTYYDSYSLNGDGSSTDGDFGQYYLSSPDGTIRIGYGQGPFLAINVAFQAPSFSGSGVYLNPVGVVNAASSAPFTAFISPGEFLTLYGSGLAPTTDSATIPFPPSLDGVKVLINQVEAPIYYVSSTQISVIVPYITTPGSVAQIQVINNGANSNVVTQFTGLTSVGSFTNTPVGGIGIVASERPDFSIISESNPARVGETVSLYVAGMGAVTNQPDDGTSAPSNPLSYTTNQPTVYIADTAGNYLQATVAFSGLAPDFAGLYQLNVTIPSGLTTTNEDTYPEIYGPDSDTFEAVLPVSDSSSGAAVPAAQAKSDKLRTRVHHHRMFRLKMRGSANQQ